MGPILHAFTSRRMAVILALAFSSGIPLALTAGTLQAWMASEKVDLTLIGIFSLVGVPYTFKFLWSPFMDRYVPPFLGRRRGWILVTQALLIVSILAMAFSDPAREPFVMAALALLVAFASASQDIVVDAYRTESLKSEELGIGAGVHVMGYRIAMLVSGAFALILSDHISWRAVYGIMASTVGIGMIATLFAPEPTVEAKPPRSMKEAVLEPLAEFLKRKGAIEVLAFIILYRLDVVIGVMMMTPFLLELGFTRTDIGAVGKGFGLISTIIGALTGGVIMARIGMKKALWAFGIGQGFSNLTFLALAQVGYNYPLMVAAIALENLCSGLGTAAFLGFIMSLCDKRFTATQYAVLSSVMALTRVFAGAPTGYMAKHLGWEMYYLVSTLVMIPGLLLLLRYDQWHKPNAT